MRRYERLELHVMSEFTFNDEFPASDKNNPQWQEDIFDVDTTNRQDAHSDLDRHATSQQFSYPFLSNTPT
jgi:hypothetical protein